MRKRGMFSRIDSNILVREVVLQLYALDLVTFVIPAQ